MIESIVKKLLELFAESVITQSLLVLFVFGPIAYCIISGIPIPDTLDKYGFVIIGFFFGSKSTLQVMKGLGR